MTNLNDSIDFLYTYGNSLTSKPTIDLTPIKSDDSINTIVRIRPKVKSESRKKSYSRYIEPQPSRSTSTIRPISYHEDENYYHHHHHHRHHHHQRQQNRQSLPPDVLQTPVDINDMRFFIIRHGERVDRYFGSNWFMLAFDQFGQYRPYHANFPTSLPSRPNKYYWALDTPLTRDGLNAAHNVGQVLALNSFSPTYVYSSPAMRCVLTTSQILKGLGLDKKIAIRIEPGLLELGAARFGMSVFLKPNEWQSYGINVDSTYRPVLSEVPSVEREAEYYLRSKYVVRELEQRHGKSMDSESPLINVLLVAHATSPETLTWDLIGRQPNVYDLYALSLKIGYLQMVITERKRLNKYWSLTQMPLQSTTLKWV